MSTSKKDVLEQLTECRPKNETIHSGWGTIPYFSWCQREARRINAYKHRLVIVKENERGQVYLWEPLKNGKVRWKEMK